MHEFQISLNFVHFYQVIAVSVQFVSFMMANLILDKTTFLDVTLNAEKVSGVLPITLCDS